MNKSILFVHLLNDFSGSPKVLSNVMKITKNMGFKNYLLTSRAELSFFTDLTDGEFNYEYDISSKRWLGLIKFLWIQFFSFYYVLKNYQKFEIIYVNTLLPFGAAFAGYITRRKIIYHLHESYLKPVILMKFLLFLVKITASRVIFVSKYLNDCLDVGQIPSFIVYNTSDIKLVSKKDFESEKPEKFIVLMLSSLKVYKGIFEFISLAKSMVDNKNVKFELVLNADEDEIHFFFNKKIIPPNVTIFSRTIDTNVFYERASVVVNLTRSDLCIETFGLTILEGLFFNNPAIVPKVGGPTEIITDGENGYHIDSKDIMKLREAINLLSSNKEIYKRMCLKAKLTSEKFSFAVFQDSIKKVFDNFL